jgi:hypothetical protein
MKVDHNKSHIENKENNTFNSQLHVIMTQIFRSTIQRHPHIKKTA